MKHKKGMIIGSVLGLFWATIAIVVILFLFVFVSGAVKMFGGIEEGVKIRYVDFEEGVGNAVINNIKFMYVREYVIDDKTFLNVLKKDINLIETDECREFMERLGISYLELRDMNDMMLYWRIPEGTPQDSWLRKTYGRPVLVCNLEQCYKDKQAEELVKEIYLL
ncbi:MAG: hypothetical protein ACP5D2_04140, partial [Candidatus Nanoarchaeia archaeon]